MGNYKPRIYRAWSCRIGAFYWAVSVPKANTWTGMTLGAARTLERQAQAFAKALNSSDHDLQVKIDRVRDTAQGLPAQRALPTPAR